MPSPDLADHMAPSAQGGRHGSIREVFLAFLSLGLTSFGGPVAHLGYFRTEFVLRRQWLTDERYADLVSLCQFLPGPASSQVGFSIGLLRAGSAGALAAWLAFTLPSAILLVAFAGIADGLSGPVGLSLLHGLKLVAVAVVAQAVQGMAATLCPDRARAGIGTAAAVLLLLWPAGGMQLAVIAAGAAAGLLWCRSAGVAPARGQARWPWSRAAGGVALACYVLLLIVLPLLAHALPAPELVAASAFYRSGALVFGGGHVVLPLLRQSFVDTGLVGDDIFLAGYGAAQAVPGPLFTFAAYLGARILPGAFGLPGAAIGLAGIFLPGMLVLLGALPFWASWSSRAGARAAMQGINAAVVGLLGATLYTPVFTSSVGTPADFALALAAFMLLTVWKLRPLLVVALTAAASVSFALLSGALP